MDTDTNEQALAVQEPGHLQAAGQAVGPDLRQMALTTAFQGLIPTSIGEALTLAKALSTSKAIPKAYRGNPDTILTVIMAGLEVGLTPIRSLNNLTNISGNLGMKADLQLALVRRSGLLEYYDEGFEIKGKTDGDLAVRAADGGKVLALVKAVPDGKPYGWATAQRKGDRHPTTRTFTWTDAETAEIWGDDDGNGGERKKTKLSAKFNYTAFPADMYPKRARGRVLQITHSDVLAGMLSTEALEDGQVIDVTPLPDTPDDLLADAGDAADAIRGGFDALEFGQARRTQKLVEYRGRYGDLVTWLRDEYGQRTGQGKAGTARKAKAAARVIDAETAPRATAPAPPADQTTPPAGEDYPDRQAIADFVAAHTADEQAESFVKALDGKFPSADPPADPKPADPKPAIPTSRAAQAAAKIRERFGDGASF